MEAMAEDTGGQAFYNTNGLTQAVQKAIENGSNYYTLTYSPNNMDVGCEVPVDQGEGGPAGREADLSQRLLRGRSQ